MPEAIIAALEAVSLGVKLAAEASNLIKSWRSTGVEPDPNVVSAMLDTAKKASEDLNLKWLAS